MQPQATQMRPSRNPVARTLAVFALVAAAIMLVVVVAGSIGGSSGNSGSGQHASRARHDKPKHKYVGLLVIYHCTQGTCSYGWDYPANGVTGRMADACRPGRSSGGRNDAGNGCCGKKYR